MSKPKYLVICVLIVAVIIIGEVYVYTVNDERYDSSVFVGDDTVNYNFKSSGSNIYDMVVVDNDDFSYMSELYIYSDATYASLLEDVRVPVGAKALTQDYYISQLLKMLEYRGVDNVKIVDASQLGTALSNDIGAGDCDKGLIVLSGVLPSTVYTGEGSKIFDWMESGGRLYWIGNFIGKWYADGVDIVPVDGYQNLFFGCECLNENNEGTAYSDDTSNDFRYTLSLMNNNVRYSIDASKLPSERQVLTAGYSEGGYSSIVMTDFGNGMICVFGGDLSNYQRHDLAQIISSGLCYSSTQVAYVNGPVHRDIISGAVDIPVAHGDIVAYVYYGGYYPVYGRTTAEEVL